MNTPELTRLRIVYAKTTPLRYTGHLDLLRIWERTFRRSKLPLAYSQGFSPQPRIQMAAALPLGFTSRCEIIDIWLDKPVSLDVAKQNLAPALPPGIEITSFYQVDLKEPALQNRINASDYQISLLMPDQRADLETSIQRVLTAPSLPRQRRDKDYDLRPLIYQLELIPPAKLFLQLSHREGATGRPEEVLDEMAIPLVDTLVERTALHFQ